jgi:hypothetical protein
MTYQLHQYSEVVEVYPKYMKIITMISASVDKVYNNIY